MKTFLPRLLATITRRPRQRVVRGVDFEWNARNWSYNVFRFFELVFGRAYGKNGVGDTIRIEMASYLSEEGVAVYEFFTWEALVVHTEAMVRSFFKMPKHAFGWQFVPVPQLVTAGGRNVRIPVYSFAIAFDAVDTPGNGAAPQTVSHTVTGSNPFILGMFAQNAGASISGATYNSIAMTSSGTAQVTSDVTQAIYFLLAPATGAHSLVLSGSGTVFNSGVSYSGVSQSNSTEITGSYATGNSASSPYNLSVTSTASNCWLAGQSRNTGNTNTAGGTCVQRIFNLNSEIDTNAAVASGAHNLTWTFSSATTYGQGISFAPVSVVSVNSNFLAFM